MKLTDQLFHCISKWRLEHRKKELIGDSELLDFCLFTFEIQSVGTDGTAILSQSLNKNQKLLGDKLHGK